MGNQSAIKSNPYIIACIAVLAGGGIYVLWRPDTIRFFDWLEVTGIRAPVDTIRAFLYPLHTQVPEWILYSLPNGLWAFSYALIIWHMWRTNTSIIKYFWLATIPLVGIGYELLQYTGILPGTFCYQDLTMSVAGIGLGIATGLTCKAEDIS